MKAMPICCNYPRIIPITFTFCGFCFWMYYTFLKIIYQPASIIVNINNHLLETEVVTTQSTLKFERNVQFGDKPASIVNIKSPNEFGLKATNNNPQVLWQYSKAQATQKPKQPASRDQPWARPAARVNMHQMHKEVGFLFYFFGGNFCTIATQ